MIKSDCLIKASLFSVLISLASFSVNAQNTTENDKKDRRENVRDRKH